MLLHYRSSAFRVVVISLFLLLADVGCMPAHHAGEGHTEESTGRHGSDHESTGGTAQHVRPHARARRDPATVEAASRIRVLPRNDLTCKTEVLGLVDVHEGMATVEEGLGELKLRAAELGAEAVVGVDFEHGDGHAATTAATHLSGMAVRCRDLIRGRTYDVIAELDVPGDMGGEEEAFRRIKAKGSALRADLLIDVAFEHGEGGRERLAFARKRFASGKAKHDRRPLHLEQWLFPLTGSTAHLAFSSLPTTTLTRRTASA